MKTWVIPMEFVYRGDVVVRALTPEAAVERACNQEWESDDLHSLIDWGVLGSPREDK